MTNQEKIEKVKQWQSAPHHHPLTCGNYSLHAELKPVERKGRVVLMCNDCGFLQEIPDSVLQADLKTPEEAAAAEHEFS